MHKILTTLEFVPPLLRPDYQPYFPGEITWQRCALVLKLMSESGISIRRELSVRIGRELSASPRSGMILRIFHRLQAAGLIINKIFPLVGASRLALVRLTDAGRELCCSHGWACVESDWERLTRLRCADPIPQYLTHTLEFAYQARMRNYDVLVAPGELAGNPDLVVCQYGDELPVFILRKGVTAFAVREIVQKTAGERIGIVTSRLRHRGEMIRLFSSALSWGAASDIETLIAQVRSGKTGELWLDRWA